MKNDPRDTDTVSIAEVWHTVGLQMRAVTEPDARWQLQLEESAQMRQMQKRQRMAVGPFTFPSFLG